MTFETETVLDRRRLRRRLSLWRGLAVLAAILAFGLIVFSSAEGVGLTERRQIARVSLEGHHHRGPRPAEALQAARREQAGRGGDPVHQQPRRHHHRRRGPVRGHPRAGQGQARGGADGNGGDLGRLHRRARHRPHGGARQHHHRLGRRHLPVGGGVPAARQARRQDERDQERAAEGQPLAVPADRRGRQGAWPSRWWRNRKRWFVGLVADAPRHRHRQRRRASSRAASSPAARRSPTS